MQRIPVNSSYIVSVGYDPKERLLEIEFQEGRVYQYVDVAPEVHQQFMRADSHGEYFYGFISQRYRYHAVEQSNKVAPTSLAFVTGNAHKMAWLKAACEPFGIAVEQVPLPVDEIQSHDAEDIAVKKAKAAYAIANRPVLTCDNYWSILALKGFPGAYMSYMVQWLTAADFLKLMEGKTNRVVTLQETLVYYDGKRAKVFTSSHNGVITDKPKGKGLSITEIVIMDGQTQTIAERETDQKVSVNIDERAYHEFAKWYHMQKRLGKA